MMSNYLKSSYRSQDIEVFVLIFGHVEKRLDRKEKPIFEIYDVKTWLTNNCNTHIDQYLQK